MLCCEISIHFQISNDEFFSTAIMNIIKSRDSHVTSRNVTSLRSVSYTDVGHLVARIQEPSYALRVSKWLAKELKNGANRSYMYISLLCLRKEEHPMMS